MMQKSLEMEQKLFQMGLQQVELFQLYFEVLDELENMIII